MACVGATVVDMRSALVLLLALPAPGVAQESGTTVGAVVGWTSTEQIWEPDAEVDRVGGVVFGAWVDAGTPAGWLSVVAEGAFTQRGGDVLASDGGAVEGAVRSDYLSISVRPGARAALGPARVHLSAGPALDIVLRSRLDTGLAPVLPEEGGQIFGGRRPARHPDARMKKATRTMRRMGR